MKRKRKPVPPCHDCKRILAGAYMRVIINMEYHKHYFCGACWKARSKERNEVNY